MDFKVLMESILLIDTINKYLDSSEEKFYYEKSLLEYKLVLIKYINAYFNSALDDPSKLLGFLNKINNTVKDGLNTCGLFVKKYDSDKKMYMDLLNLTTICADKSDYDKKNIDLLFNKAVNDYNDDMGLSCIYEILKHSNFFETDFEKEKDAKIKKLSKPNKNDE